MNKRGAPLHVVQRPHRQNICVRWACRRLQRRARYCSLHFSRSDLQVRNIVWEPCLPSRCPALVAILVADGIRTRGGAEQSDMGMATLL